jgi:plastocyanin
MSSSVVPRPILLVGLLACAVVLAACGGSTSTPAASAAASAAGPSEAAPTEAAPSEAAPSEAPAAGGGDAVTIKNFAFGPASLSVVAGSTVTWTNDDSAAHTATADDGSFDSSSIAPGSTFSQTFDAAGMFAYHCSIHPDMKATIEVQ